MNHHSKENPAFPLDQEVVAGTTTVTGNDDVVMVMHPQRLRPNEQFRDEKAAVSNAIQMLHSAIDRVINEEIMQPMIEQQQQHRAMMEEFHSTPIPPADENQTTAFLVRTLRPQRCLFMILILLKIPSYFFHRPIYKISHKVFATKRYVTKLPVVWFIVCGLYSLSI